MTNAERFPFNNIHETAQIAEGVVIGTGNTIGPFCIIGFPPEWKGMEHFSGKVVIGNNNRITGLVTIDSGTVTPTKIGNGCYLMKKTHQGHDSIIGNNVTVSCGTNIGGHTIIKDWANIGLGVNIHQKQEIAEGVMLGMGAVITRKLKTEPYKKYVGNPAKLIGDNDLHPNYTIFMQETL